MRLVLLACLGKLAAPRYFCVCAAASAAASLTARVVGFDEMTSSTIL
jgi:hypothetical protein